MSDQRRPAALALAALLGLSCRSSAPDRTTPPASDPRPAPAQTQRQTQRPAPAQTPRPKPGRDAESGRAVGITAAHNRVRGPLGVAPLTWSNELARYAQAWADKLQRQGCRLQHRPGSGPDAQRFGENLSSATGYAPTVDQVVEMWADEVKHYNPKTNGCKGICGHYTQVVWRKSQRLGCATASCGATEIWVCNYDPPGNYVGQRPY